MVSSILTNDSVSYVDICFTNQVEFVAVSNRISYYIKVNLSSFIRLSLIQTRFFLKIANVYFFPCTHTHTHTHMHTKLYLSNA